MYHLTVLYYLFFVSASLPYDLLCYVKFLGNITEKDNRVKHASVLVSGENSSNGPHEIVLTRGEPMFVTLKYSPYSSSVPDQNPRNLSLLFDGEKVYGTMAYLVDHTNSSSGSENQRWDSCAVNYGEPGKSFQLTYYDHHIDTPMGIRADRRENAYIETRPYDTPFPPSYDNTCAYFHKADLARQVSPKNISPRVLNITHIRERASGSYSFTRITTLKWQGFVTVVPGQLTFLQFNQTTARDKYDWVGQNVVTRNLTLWLNETGHLQAAMAYLRQKDNNAYGNLIEYEEWECPVMDYSDEVYIYTRFSEYSSFIASINMGRYDRDIVIINGCVTNRARLVSSFFLLFVWVLIY